MTRFALELFGLVFLLPGLALLFHWLVGLSGADDPKPFTSREDRERGE